MDLANENHRNKVLIAIVLILFTLIVFNNRSIVEQDEVLEVIDDLNDLKEEDTERDMNLTKLKGFLSDTPVTYYRGQYQKIGQTFEVDEYGEMSAIEFVSTYATGTNLYVTLYMLPDDFQGHDIQQGKIVGRSKYDVSKIVKGAPFAFVFDEPVTLWLHTKYAFVVEIKDKNTSVKLVRSTKNIYNDGISYRFIRPITVNGIIPDDNSWQPQHTADIVFRLIYN